MDCKKLIVQYNPYTRPKGWFDMPAAIRVESSDGRGQEEALEALVKWGMECKADFDRRNHKS
jgi:hypothetical protein